MTDIQHAIKHGGLTARTLLNKITRRHFGATILGGAGVWAGSKLIRPSGVDANGADFTLAIIPDPQFLTITCPSSATGSYYTALMQWIVSNQNLTLHNSGTGYSFGCPIQAVVGVGDCVNVADTTEFALAQAGWSILDSNGMPFITPPGNHDFAGAQASRGNMSSQFLSGYFSATTRSGFYPSTLYSGGSAQWLGNYDDTGSYPGNGANTAVLYTIGRIKMLFLSLTYYAGNAAWAWAWSIAQEHMDAEWYITTHGWITSKGTQFYRGNVSDGGNPPLDPNNYSGLGPNFSGGFMGVSPYANCTVEAWGGVSTSPSFPAINTWPNLVCVVNGHDLGNGSGSWNRTPVASSSARGQVVQQIYANDQQVDSTCTTGGNMASVLLLTRRPSLGLLEGRIFSTQSLKWMGGAPQSPSWSTTETVLFSIPFTGLEFAQNSGPSGGSGL